jgi:hypothetical protein
VKYTSYKKYVHLRNSAYGPGSQFDDVTVCRRNSHLPAGVVTDQVKNVTCQRCLHSVQGTSAILRSAYNSIPDEKKEQWRKGEISALSALSALS